MVLWTLLHVCESDHRDLQQNGTKKKKAKLALEKERFENEEEKRVLTAFAAN